jgi:hypothetical protein
MRVHGLPLSLAAACLLAGGMASPAAVAESAPPVEPSQWLNSKTPISWDGLKGRVILVEKWATW